VTGVDARWPFHEESGAIVDAPASTLFAHLDDPVRQTAHMSRRSWRMGGGRMRVVTDGAHGRAIGSVLTLSGRAFGVPLFLREVVTERRPDARKTWETVGAQRLLVIGAYRMGFTIDALGGSSRLRVFIDYALPAKLATRWPGRALARAYARWCTRRMVADAVRNVGGRPD
jgi:hypothetical protein